VEIEIEDNVEITKEVIQSLELQGMERAMHQINYQHKEEDILFYCVGYSVTQYYLNGFVMRNLSGHKGTTMGADILSTFLPTEVVNSLYKVIELAGLEVYSLTLEPIAAIEVAIP
jgi:cell division ATPase FtsA